ncbi:MAG: CopG family transcriptional regulator, partial [Oscillospiraceae bacterium]
MGKSVYSMILSDRVVERLDALAAREGISRSAAVDRILAAHLSMTTPEQAMQEVLAEVGRLLEQSTLQLLPTLADGFLAVRAPVRFKYNPAVRVVVELFPAAHGTAGELRAAARTQSAGLIEALDGFFSLFAQAERFDPGEVAVGGGRFSLRLML